jgi:hypothetical protein
MSLIVMGHSELAANEAHKIFAIVCGVAALYMFLMDAKTETVVSRE